MSSRTAIASLGLALAGLVAVDAARAQSPQPSSEKTSSANEPGAAFTELVKRSQATREAFLAKWDAALYDDRLLSLESRQLAFTPATHTDNPSIDYAFGWRVTGETLWHSGETRGFRNVFVRYPERRLSVIVLTNRNEPEPYSTAVAIAELFKPETRHP